jgi:hypothetical protein
MTAPRARRPQIDPAYAGRLEGILRFKTLADTEQSIADLENLRQRFLAASDKRGVENCRRLGALGRQRAEQIARNRRTGAAQRLLKQEAALWFRIWLETPDLFPGWLSLRKDSHGFRKLQELESGIRSA